MILKIGESEYEIAHNGPLSGGQRITIDCDGVAFTARLYVDRRPQIRRAGRMPTRKAMLHSWLNVRTGQRLKNTISEFNDTLGLGMDAGKNLIDTGATSRCGWKHEAALHYVIQGNAIDWLTKGAVRGGSRSAQMHSRLSKAWDKWALILGMYHAGHGTKAIGAALGINPPCVHSMLIESGVDTGKRRNYAKSSPATTDRQKAKLQYLRDIENTSGRLKRRIMSRIWSAMKRQNVNGSGTFAVVGCTPEQLRQHIEKQFQPGMSFDNYGEWHVDHMRPCASFDLNDPAQFTECFNWRNLQPLWAADNLRKSDSYAQN
jgi:hypothetical protein